MKSNQINDGQISLKSNEVYSDIKNDVQINITTEISTDSALSSQIVLSAGVIYVYQNLTFQNIKFNRSTVNVNNFGFYLRNSETLTFFVFTLNYLRN